MKKIFLALTVFTVLLIAACSKKTAAGKTAAVKTTTYVVDVQPLIQMKCTPCHLPSKGGNKANFENYASAQKYGADMLTRVQLNPGDRGFMPFKHPKLADEEIALLKKWVADGLLEK